MIKLRWHIDAGHGWLAVKRKVLKELGIITKITGYSYQRGETVYLEEDMDAGFLVEKLTNDSIPYVCHHPNNWPDRSPVRSYEYFELREDEQ